MKKQVSKKVKKEVEQYLEDPNLLRILHQTPDILDKIYELRKNNQSIQKQVAMKLGMAESNFSRKVNILKEYKIVNKIKPKSYYNLEGKSISDPKVYLLELTEKGHKIYLYTKKFPLPELNKKSKLKSSIGREFHSEQIREVIKKLLDTFIVVDFNGAFTIEKLSFSEEFNDFHNDIKSFYDGGNLFLEDTEVLYSDLINHLKFFNEKNFDETMEDFKKECKKFNDKIKNIKNKISSSLTNHFDIKISKKWSPGLLSPRIIDYFYEASYYLASKNNPRFEEFYPNFKSRIEEEKTSNGEIILVYRVGPYSFLKESNVDWPKKERFKEIMDGKLSEFLNKLNKTTFYKSLKDCISLRNELEMLRAEITKKLKKNLHVAIFPGDCEYLDPGK